MQSDEEEEQNEDGEVEEDMRVPLAPEEITGSKGEEDADKISDQDLLKVMMQQFNLLATKLEYNQQKKCRRAHKINQGKSPQKS